MHLVITNAWKGDPYTIDTLFLYMANMAWNSAMNTESTIAMLTDKDPATGDYKIPRIIYADAFYSEMVAYADLVLPDTTYLERWDCLSLLDRPISHADGPADAIRRPVVTPDRDVRPFQDVLLDLGARLGLPGMTKEDGSARYPGGYADYLVNHERRPGIGPLAGWRGDDGGQHGAGAVNPDQLERYIENGCFWQHKLAPEQLYFKFANRAYLDYAAKAGFVVKPDAIVHQLYSEELQRFRLAARGHGKVQPPPEHRARIETYFDPLPFWYPPFEDDARRQRRLPAPRDHPAADGDVSQLGLAERLAAPDPRQQPALRAARGRGAARARRRRLGVGDQPHRAHQGADPRHGRRQRAHRLDLERHRQAGGRLEPRPRGARGDARFPAQSPDRRAPARNDRRRRLWQCRSGDRTGGVVRHARAPREGDRRPRPARRYPLLPPIKVPPGLARRPEALTYGAQFRAGRSS